MKRVVILGAGVTGLAAADRLAALGGCEVTVVEAELAVGGLAATVRREGVATDLGPHRLYSELGEVEAFWPQLLGDDLLRVRRSSRMRLDGCWISYPLRGFEVARAVGLRRVLGLGAGMAVARAGAAFSRRPPASFEAAMKRAFGAVAYKAIFEPYARKVWRIEPSALSAEIARVRLPARGMGTLFSRRSGQPSGRASGPLREFQYVRGGIGRLCDSLAARVSRAGGRILLDSRAVGLKSSPSGVVAAVIQRPDGAVTLEADAVVSTVPLPVLGAMVAADDSAFRDALGQLEYLSLILVVLIAAADRIGPDHWLYFPQEPPVVTRACEPKNFDRSMAPPGRSALCCEITCRRNEPLYRASDDELAGRVGEEMIAVGLLQPEQIVARFVLRADWAYPVYALGFEERLAAVWPALSRIANLISVGRQGLFNHNNIDHSLVMGWRAAEAVAGSASPAAAWYGNLSQFAHFRILD